MSTEASPKAYSAETMVDDEIVEVKVEVLCNGVHEWSRTRYWRGSVGQAIAFLLARIVEKETDDES